MKYVLMIATMIFSTSVFAAEITLDNTGAALKNGDAAAVSKMAETKLAGKISDTDKIRAYVALALAQDQLGRPDKARQTWNKVMPLMEKGGDGLKLAKVKVAELNERLAGREASLFAKREQALRDAGMINADGTSEAVAVAPLINVTDNKDWDAISEALSDMIIGDLVMAGNLKVVERARIKDALQEIKLQEGGMTKGDTKSWGKLTQASHVVSGTCSTGDTEDSIIIQSLSSNLKTSSASASSQEGSVVDIFALQRALVTKIVRDLGVIDFKPEELGKGEDVVSTSPVATIAVIKGMQAFNAGDKKKTAKILEEALIADPECGAAAKLLSDVRTDLGDKKGAKTALAIWKSTGAKQYRVFRHFKRSIMSTSRLRGRVSTRSFKSTIRRMPRMRH